MAAIAVGLFLRHRSIKLDGAGRAPELLKYATIPHFARNGSERIELVELGAGRQEKQEDEADGLTVDSLELDRLAEAHQEAERLFDLAEARMRDGDAAAEPCRPELVALFE